MVEAAAKNKTNVQMGFQRRKAAVKLAMISFETGSRITWKQESGEISGPDGTASLILRDYRAPWKHPGRA